MKKLTDLFMIYIFQPIFNLYFSLTKRRVGNNIYQITKDIKLKARPNTSDTGVISEIYDLKEYTRDFEINPSDTIVDIGAHIGAFSVYAAKKAKKVISYEPSSENFKILLENKKLNNLKNLEIHQKAVSAKNQKIKLFLDLNNLGGNSIYGSQEYITVNSTTLCQIFKDNNLTKINLLKIDAEGAEYKIIFNTHKKYLDKIENIAMEYHDNFNLAHNHKDLKNFLEKNGFEVKVFSFPFFGHLYHTGLLKATRRVI